MSDAHTRDRAALDQILEAQRAWHRRVATLPIKEKVRILLELQRQDYPLLARHRSLRWWERPWNAQP